MNRKKIVRKYLLAGKVFQRLLLTFVFTIIYIIGSFLATPTTYAAGVPGGNISDPIVRAVDIAKPAVVRILTTLGGRLTVHFTSTNTATFPQGGGSYKLQYLGSGAFISANGDILTADHVIRPPHDAAIDQDLYQLAAQDVADYINNNLNPPVPWTSTDAFSALSYGQLLSRSQYDTPTSRVYLSTDFTGPTNVTTLDAMPQNTYADVDSILKESNFQSMDTAIIHVNIHNTPSIKLGDSTNVAQQDQLTIIGFPGNGDVSDTGNPSTGFFTPSVNKVYVSALKQNNGGAPLVQVGGNVEHGDSGGPALDNNGNIVGVVSFGGTNMPDGTSFLQASSSAQQLISGLQLDTRPGAFQTAWNQAFAQYSSTQEGHWHNAQQQMQKLQNNYPNFHAIQPYLNYANEQAGKEKTPTTNTLSSSNLIPLAGIVLVVLVVLFLFILFLFLGRRRKKAQPAFVSQQAAYQPAYNGNGASSDIQHGANSGSVARVEPADNEDPNARTTPGVLQAQPRAIDTPPQTLMPVAASNFAQSGPIPAAPNQAPMSPWPQGTGYVSAPGYRQPASYGQPPARPVQGQPNPAYPAQQPQQPYSPYQPQPQQQYASNMSYSQPPVTPWPPQNPNAPHVSYAPQNPAQQGAPTQRGQQPPANGTPYAVSPGYPQYGQSPQGYGAAPSQPTQTSQQSSTSIPAQHRQAYTPLSPETPTRRSNPQNIPASDETVRLAEDKKNSASSIPTLFKDEEH